MLRNHKGEKNKIAHESFLVAQFGVLHRQHHPQQYSLDSD
jgi:hypothetical protein